MTQEKKHALRQSLVVSLLTFVIAVPLAHFLIPLMGSSTADAGYPWRVGLLVAVINGVLTYRRQNSEKREQ